MTTLQETLANAYKNKSVIQAHMRQHQAHWDVPPPVDPNHPIQVFVRVRPLLERDVAADAFSLVMVQAPRTIHFTHPTNRWAGGRFATKTYDADGVFDESATNDEVYDRIGLKDMVKHAIEGPGREFCVMAYGQTGTGKTYTTTAIEERLTADVFALLPQENPPKLSLTAFEIRGGKAYDLLSDPPHNPVQITSTNGSSASYPGLSSHLVSAQEDLVALLAKSKDLRMTRSTVKNDTSSRSHCIVTLRVEHSPGEGSDIVIVDLAGTERSSYATKNDPERVKESIETNKGLAALKDCIRARLSSSTQHIPWRGSKLTMVLRGAFEQANSKRSSKLIILACVSPSVIDSEDTMGTLKYITPFQLTGNDAVDAATDHTVEGSVLDNAEGWTHEDSVGYIKRQLPKLVPVISRLLPTPDSTIASLFPLSSAELLALASTPAANEDPKTPLLDARSTNQLRTWIDGYHKKLVGLQKRSMEDEERKAKKAAAKRGVQRSGATKEARLLKTLDGLNLEANETGFVTRVNRLGQIVQVPVKEKPGPEGV